MQRISIVGLESFPLVKVGDDLAKMIVEAAKRENARIDRGDVIVVAQKVVSKAEGRVAQLRNVKPSERAEEVAKITSRDPRLLELALRGIRNIVKVSQETLIVENRRGLVCINAGIDKSNVDGDDSYALLPEDPDQSAEKIKSQISRMTGKEVAVIICDTYSRPLRKGQVEFAIGIAGINPFKNYRGHKDLFDYVLKVKNVAIVDEIACAAELVMGQGDEGIPVVIVKNVQRAEVNGSLSAEDINISKEEDLFKGTL